jgi:hypothetical protein
MPEVPESRVIADNPPASAPPAGSKLARKSPANQHLVTRDPHTERPHRTQEVAGSSPAGSIR